VDYINSYSKKSDQMIKNINKELNSINLRINSLKGKEEKDITGFFNRINKQQKEFIEQFEFILEKSTDISEKFELIEELSSKISLIAFNIEIQASKTQYNKVFSVLAKEVRDFSDQMHKYYKSMALSFFELNDFIKKNGENITNFQKEVIDKIQLANDVFSKYDESMINIQQILSKLISESENQKSQFLSKTNENFSTMQSLAINLEQMQHRNSTIYYFLNLYKKNIGSMLSLNNDHILQDEKILIEEILRYIESIITTSEERLFVNRLYKEYLNKEIKQEDIHIENKVRKTEKGSEDSDSVIIF
jgi:K+/H+ antiporter YhaU regulatory subunit KhtT